MSTDPLFFVALVPGDPIQQEVTDFKKEAAEQFNSRHALKSPAHITLKSPFRWKLKKLGRLKDVLSQITERHSPFSLLLEGFDMFEPRVIFVDTELEPALVSLQDDVEMTLRSLEGWQDDRPVRPFHPHMTVAFKDLRRSKFKSAREYFQKIDYRRTYAVTDLVLLNHRERRWHIHTRYPLG